MDSLSTLTSAGIEATPRTTTLNDMPLPSVRVIVPDLLPAEAGLNVTLSVPFERAAKPTWYDSGSNSSELVFIPPSDDCNAPHGPVKSP